jgi:hypothetical protein
VVLGIMRCYFSLAEGLEINFSCDICFFTDFLLFRSVPLQKPMLSLVQVFSVEPGPVFKTMLATWWV